MGRPAATTWQGKPGASGDSGVGNALSTPRLSPLAGMCQRGIPLQSPHVAAQPQPRRGRSGAEGCLLAAFETWEEALIRPRHCVDGDPVQLRSLFRFLNTKRTYTKCGGTFAGSFPCFDPASLLVDHKWVCSIGVAVVEHSMRLRLR
jgi:hypothetical protein